MIAGDRGGRHAGQHLGAREDRRDEGVLLAKIRPRGEVSRVARPRQLVFGLQHAPGLEAGIDAQQVPEAADQQTGARQQHDGQRELAGHEHRSKGRPRPARRAARAVGLERGLQIDAACMQRRHEAEQETGGERHRESD